MNCAETRERLSPLLDGALHAEETRAAEEHLLACTDCQEHRDGLSEVVGLVREIPAPTAPDGFAQAVVAALPVARPRTPPARSGRSITFLVPFAAAACVLILVGIAHFGSEPGPAKRDVAWGPTETQGTPPAGEYGDEGAGAKKREATRDLDDSEAAVRAETSAPSDPEELSPSGGSAPQGPVGGGAEGESFTGKMREKEGALETARESGAGLAAGGGGSGGRADGPSRSRAPKPMSRDAEEAADKDVDVDVDGAAFRLSGADADAAAGWIFAELGRRRLGEKEAEADGKTRDSADEKGQATGEILRNQRGELSHMYLDVTRCEFRFIRALVEDERGAQLTRIGDRRARPGTPRAEPPPEVSAPDAPPPAREEAEEDAHRNVRMRVEIRFGQG